MHQERELRLAARGRVAFVAAVATDGYEVREEEPAAWSGPPAGPPYLVARGEVTTRRYPLASPRLADDFAALAGADDFAAAAARFAGRWGLLTERHPVFSPALLGGEPLSQWRQESTRLAGVVELAGVLRRGDNLELSRRVVIKDGTVMVKGSRHATALPPVIADQLANADPIRRARAGLHTLLLGKVNAQLADLSHVVLVAAPSPGLTPGGELRARPRNLLGAIYLQLGLSVAGIQPVEEVRTCPVCLAQFPDAGKRRYCGDRCRKRAFDQRHPQRWRRLESEQ